MEPSAKSNKSSSPALSGIKLSLPTCSRSSSAPKNNDTALQLESRQSSLETLVTQLTSENVNLRQTVSQLQQDFAAFAQQRVRDSATDNSVTGEQQNLNTNIVIRGINVREDSSESEIRAVYEGIRSHLNVSDCNEFDPL
ncbi:hypothetical protein Bhyg_16861 [Pseudolycoriella hygida]|uniref:Uncharacterized protein n=1 Tax=Pseudolycoriella hygida TaxID=35572 RepID=A0A9Q0MJY1_9DIPT|nr:hypothetical protein Bhyg_16861 [Pseudolycoriella hygida]